MLEDSTPSDGAVKKGKEGMKRKKGKMGGDVTGGKCYRLVTALFPMRTYCLTEVE